MHRHATIFIINLCLITTGFAQLDSFDLRDFVLPEVRIKSLDMSARVSGNNEKKKQFPNTQSNTLKAQIDLRYRHFYNSPKIQQESNGSVFLDYDIRNSSEVSPFSQMSQLAANNSISMNTTIRSYFKPKRFWGYGGAASVNYNQQNIQTNISGVNQKSAYVDIRPKIQYGVGRVEPVRSAWKALRMLRTFEKFGLLQHAPSTQEIHRLAQTIANNDYTRVFDSRLSVIERMKAIDQQIQNDQLINSTGSAYFTLLYDSYLYGIQGSRFAGNRLTFELQPDFQLPLLQSSFITNLFGNISYESFNPINQYWQVDYSLKYYTNSLYLNNKQQSSLHMGINASFSAGYYPNSRTDFRVRIDYNQSLTDSRIRSSKYPFSVSTRVNYYLSPRTIITAYFSANQSIYSNSMVTLPFGDVVSDRQGYGVIFRHSFF